MQTNPRNEPLRWDTEGKRNMPNSFPRPDSSRRPIHLCILFFRTSRIAARFWWQDLGQAKNDDASNRYASKKEQRLRCVFGHCNLCNGKKVNTLVFIPSAEASLLLGASAPYSISIFCCSFDTSSYCAVLHLFTSVLLESVGCCRQK